MPSFHRERQSRWAAGALGAGLAFVLLPASAQESPAPASLPQVPRWVLSLPPPNPGGGEAGVKNYWQGPGVPSGARDFADSELRLRVETGRWNLGRLSIVSELTSVPGRERDCQPDCRGPEWSPTLILKYDLGQAGPLEHVGPTLKLGGTPAQPGQKLRGLSAVGVGGAF